MSKDITLPALALAGGAAGFFLRRWQLNSAYRPDTGLFVHGAPATYALWGLTALLVVLFLLLLRKKQKGLDDFLPAFASLEAGQMVLFAAAWILLLAAGGMGMLDGFQAIRQWGTAPDSYQLSFPFAMLLTGALCIAAGFGVLGIGQMAYRGNLIEKNCFLVPFPALAALVWLFSTHLKHGTEPVLMKYVFTLFAALFFTLAHYYAAGFLYGRPRPRLTAFCALMGTTVGIISLADRLDRFTAIATVAFTLSALALARALLGGPWPERMPPPEEDTDDI